MILSAAAGSLAMAARSPRWRSAWTFSAVVPAWMAARSAGIAWCFAKPTSTSSASMRPLKLPSPTARVSISKTILLPPMSAKIRATVARRPASSERRSSASAACSTALFTLGMSPASAARSVGSAPLSALTKGTKSVLSGFLSIRRANTWSRARETFASGAFPVTTSSSLSKSAAAGASTDSTKASSSSGLFQEAALNWASRSFPEGIFEGAA